jgi:uncharacterized protein YkwD
MRSVAHGCPLHDVRSGIRRGLAVALIVLLAAVAAAAAPAAQAVVNCAPSSSWGTDRADLAGQVIALINQHRATLGLAQLAVSSPLTASSKWKSLHMAGNGYFGHDDPAPFSRTAYQRVKDCGFSGSTWGENIAYGYATAQSVVTGWLGSPGHKANIENGNFTSTGVGVASNAGGQLYWTQSFGNGVAAAQPAAPAPPPPAAAPDATSPPARATPGTTPPPASAVVSSPATSRGATPSATTVLPIGAMHARVTFRNRQRQLVAAVAFVHLATGRKLASGDVRCRAEVSGKRLRVRMNSFRAESARCAWQIPAWARGKKVTGVVALQVGNSAARRLFVRVLASGPVRGSTL